MPLGYLFRERVCLRACLESALKFAILLEEVSLVVRGIARTAARTHKNARACRQLGFSKATSANSCNDQFSPLGCTSRRDPPRSPSTLPSIARGPTTNTTTTTSKMPVEPLTSFPFYVALSVNCNQPSNSNTHPHPYPYPTPQSPRPQALGSCWAYTTQPLSAPRPAPGANCVFCQLHGQLPDHIHCSHLFSLSLAHSKPTHPGCTAGQGGPLILNKF